MRWILVGLGVSLWGLSVGCGSRSDLLRAELRCEVDADCASSDLCSASRCEAGQCTPSTPVVCKSEDPCVTARCVPESGSCEYTPLTLDVDGDGHRAPLPGFLPGAPGSCGTDCNDTSPQAFPGAFEVCDRIDNDCDNVVDNGKRILPRQGDPESIPIRVPASDKSLSGARGIAFGDGVFALGYRARGRTTENRSFIQGRTPSGEPAFAETEIASVNVGNYGTPLAWSGAHFGATWQDTRRGNYRPYFTMFDPAGNKRVADLDLTDESSDSFSPDLIYDQGRFIVFWQERSGPSPHLRAQLISPDGQRVGNNIELTQPDGKDYGFPEMAASQRGYGLVYTATDTSAGGDVALEFRSFSKDLTTPISPVLRLSETGVARPKIAPLGGDFLVTWDTPLEDGAQRAIWGTIVSHEGQVLAGPAPVTPYGSSERESTLLSFGDRVLVGWAGESAGNLDIFGIVLGSGLTVVEEKTRLVGGDADSVDPHLAPSDQGYIGMIFDDYREGPANAHFVAFGCLEPLIQ